MFCDCFLLEKRGKWFNIIRINKVVYNGLEMFSIVFNIKFDIKCLNNTKNGSKKRCFDNYICY